MPCSCAFLDQGSEVSKQRLDVGPHQPSQARGRDRAFAQHEAVQLGVRGREEHVVAQQQAEPGRRVDALEPTDARLELLDQPAEDAVGGSAPERLLGLEVIRERSERDTRALGDRPCRGAGVTVVRKGLESGRDEPLARLDAALLGGSLAPLRHLYCLPVRTPSRS